MVTVTMTLSFSQERADDSVSADVDDREKTVDARDRYFHHRHHIGNALYSSSSPRKSEKLLWLESKGMNRHSNYRYGGRYMGYGAGYYYKYGHHQPIRMG